MLHYIINVFVFIVMIIEIKGDSYYNEIMESGCYNQICWKDDTYPTNTIKRQMRSINLLENFSAAQKFKGPIDLSSRSCKLCSTSMNLRIEPLSIIDAGIKYYILKNEKYNETRIEINVCAANQDSSFCHKKETRLDDTYKCKQKTTQMSVLVYNSLNNSFMGKSFTYPSACECLLSTAISYH
ncbi:unnamed protein product [Phaedon cochleariae]|uniref:Spaetzle domain-containing protein n=1 Tax=Phaedon cochleariae TaxID=80249 RepID=A0A9P0DIC9_PHACE|nr:unnamed protein product [Phaedon cochleariae]